MTKTNMKTIMLLVLVTAVLSLAGCQSDNSKNLQTYPAVKAWNDAIRNKDLTAYRKATYSNTLIGSRSGTKSIGLSPEFQDKIDKEVLEDAKKMHTATDVELRNETVTHDDSLNADLAVVEWKSANGKWQSIRLVKESGEWKVQGFAKPAAE